MKQQRTRGVVTDAGQEYFWTDEWQAGEREATEQRDGGEGKIFETGEDFLRAIGLERAKRDSI